MSCGFVPISASPRSCLSHECTGEHLVIKVTLFAIAHLRVGGDGVTVPHDQDVRNRRI